MSTLNAHLLGTKSRKATGKTPRRLLFTLDKSMQLKLSRHMHERAMRVAHAASMPLCAWIRQAINDKLREA
jgi:predicted HicB family RNase H-like nuclease